MVKWLAVFGFGFLVGLMGGFFCTALAVNAKKSESKEPESGYDDYYDHDVSGLLEED